MSDNVDNFNKSITGLVGKGEIEEIGKIKRKCNWNEFWHFLGIWSLTAGILILALVIVALVRGSDDICKDIIGSIDALNMTFSLVLSALLEQIWSGETKRGFIFNLTLGLEWFFTIGGAMFYIAYSIVKVMNSAGVENNKLLEYAYSINLGYILATVIVVILGFYARALHAEV